MKKTKRKRLELDREVVKILAANLKHVQGGGGSGFVCSDSTCLWCGCTPQTSWEECEAT